MRTRSKIIEKKVIRTIFTLGYRPWIMGGSVNYYLAAKVRVTGPHKLGKGFYGYLATGPNGKTKVADATSGAIIGDTLEEVRNDVATAPSIKGMKEQIKEAVAMTKDIYRFEVHPKEFFWKALKMDKPTTTAL